MTTATTSTNEPQTPEYQAAVDNVWFEQERAALQQMGKWFRHSGSQWYDRLDYITDLEAQMERALGKRKLGYQLDI